MLSSACLIAFKNGVYMTNRLMTCGHFESWYYYEKTNILNGLSREMLDFGPGCYACFMKRPKHYEMLVREKNGVIEPLLDPTLEKPQSKDLTLAETMLYLNIKNMKTAENWLMGGNFPGAVKQANGEWIFNRDELVEVKSRMEEIRRRNRERDLIPKEDSQEELKIDVF